MTLFSTFLLSNIDSSLLFFYRISICFYFFNVNFQPWVEVRVRLSRSMYSVNVHSNKRSLYYY